MEFSHFLLSFPGPFFELSNISRSQLYRTRSCAVSTPPPPARTQQIGSGRYLLQMMEPSTGNPLACHLAFRRSLDGFEPSQTACQHACLESSS